MSGKRLLDHDPASGVTTWFHWNDLDQKYSLEYVQDEKPWLEVNKKLFNEPDYKTKGMKDSFLHKAQIPVGVQTKWLIEEGIDIYNEDHWPKVRAKLNSPEYRYLLVTHGRL